LFGYVSCTDSSRCTTFKSIIRSVFLSSDIIHGILKNTIVQRMKTKQMDIVLLILIDWMPTPRCPKSIFSFHSPKNLFPLTIWVVGIMVVLHMVLALVLLKQLIPLRFINEDIALSLKLKTKSKTSNIFFWLSKQWNKDFWSSTRTHINNSHFYYVC